LIEEYNKTELDDNIICCALKLITGREYNTTTIRGCSQGEWQDIFYPTEYRSEFIKFFETEYFNTGSEWIIHDEENKPETPEDITGTAMYCYSYDPRKEIAEYMGVEQTDVILYEFDGYNRTEKYKLVV
jgi:DNA-binding cell septation regulator SpoVG